MVKSGLSARVQVQISIDAEKAFADVDWALLIGAKPRGPGMERRDLLDLNGALSEDLGVGRQGNFSQEVRSRHGKLEPAQNMILLPGSGCFGSVCLAACIA